MVFLLISVLPHLVTDHEVAVVSSDGDRQLHNAQQIKRLRSVVMEHLNPET